MFHFDAVIPAFLRWLDKGAANIVIADDSQIEGYFWRFGKSERRWHARVGNRHNKIGISRRLDGKLCANGFAGMLDAAPP